MMFLIDSFLLNLKDFSPLSIQQSFKAINNLAEQMGLSNNPFELT
jgi:hypothetical protein